LESALEAVATFRIAKNNELVKLRSNLSTTFDVLQIDGRLTSAELSLVSGQQRVMEALARVRFETGTLVESEPDGGDLTLETLTSLPLDGEP
jgi:16S rRNA C1402 N4-methylase RsmH